MASGSLMDMSLDLQMESSRSVYFKITFEFMHWTTYLRSLWSVHMRRWLHLKGIKCQVMWRHWSCDLILYEILPRYAAVSGSSYRATALQDYPPYNVLSVRVYYPLTALNCVRNYALTYVNNIVCISLSFLPVWRFVIISTFVLAYAEFCAYQNFFRILSAKILLNGITYVWYKVQIGMCRYSVYRISSSWIFKNLKLKIS